MPAEHLMLPAHPRKPPDVAKKQFLQCRFRFLPGQNTGKVDRPTDRDGVTGTDAE